MTRRRGPLSARDRRRLCTLFICGALAGAVAACGGKEASEDESARAVAVRTAVVTTESFADVVSAIGVVTPRPGSFAAISAPAPTRVSGIQVSAGQHVTAGATLITLESAVFESALRSARANAESARQNADRSRRLVEAGVLPRREFEQAQAALATAESDLTIAQRNRELADVKAPFDGIVTRVAAVLGSSVDVGEVLVEVADPARVDIVLSMSPAEATSLRVGAAVVVRSGGGQDRTVRGRGTVSEVGGVVDPDSRAVAVRVRTTATGDALRIGETVVGDVTVAVHRAALVLPEEALVPEGDGFRVFVVDSADVAHARAVVVGGRSGGVARIVSGVVAGERVVTYGAFGIDDGATIVPQKP